jgi:hypothetical protein
MASNLRFGTFLPRPQESGIQKLLPTSAFDVGLRLRRAYGSERCWMFALPKTYLSKFQYTLVTWVQRELLNPTLTSAF